VKVEKRNWTLITNHGAVLLWLSSNPRSTMRQIAEGIGITERQVARIVSDLVDGAMLEVRREGRCNVYSLNTKAPMRHPILSHVPLQKLLETLHVIAPMATAGSLPIFV
jgi:hypothetical protein